MLFFKLHYSTIYVTRYQNLSHVVLAFLFRFILQFICFKILFTEFIYLIFITEVMLV